ncbi:MAG: 1,4-dihydroxy-2-naphthoate polyprenyltransferase [Microthrixaceae bacterium]|nr:1,4-dihydroxy-2-naphthoate polyprenyltransferase [Microthrixaceae bacterium]
MSQPPANAVAASTPPWKLYWLGARPRTLPAAIAPVVLGTAAATPEFSLWIFACALGVALFVQIATNYANDYSDGIRGTDDPGSRSGPVRLVGNGLVEPSKVKAAMLVAFALTALCGLPLVIWVDWRLVFVGIAAIAAGWFYTGGPSPYGYAGYGELFVFVFFGLVATVGSFYVQVGSVSLIAVLCGIATGSLATALLVVNNLRDIDSDTQSGKRTLAVKIGDRSTRYLYVALTVLPFLMVPIIAGTSSRPFGALAFVAVIPARDPVTSVLTGARGKELIAVLGRTGMVQMIFAVLLAAGLVLGA